MNHRNGLALAALIVSSCTVFEGPITFIDGSGGSSSSSSSSSGSTSSSGGGSGGGGGSTSSSTSSSSTSSSSTSSSSTSSSGGPSCPSPVSDEFNGTAPHACWKVLDESRFASREMNATMGTLVIKPAQISEPDHNGWYEGFRGPLFYQEVTGDFILVVNVLASAEATHDNPPVGAYNTAGILVRDPAGSASSENWVIYDIGQQGGTTDTPNVTVGTMSKITTDSMSTKYPEGSNGSRQGLLAICRRGSTIEVLDRLYQPDRAFRSARTFTEWPVPSTLQVGLTVGTWATPSNVAGHFDWARFKMLNEQNECLAAFQEVAASLP